MRERIFLLSFLSYLKIEMCTMKVGDDNEQMFEYYDKCVWSDMAVPILLSVEVFCGLYRQSKRSN